MTGRTNLGLSSSTMSADRLRINEIFLSIQGESTRAGFPCVFVRLAGCHLRCSYCDTEYAFTEGDWRTVDDVVEQVCSHEVPLVEITGGELGLSDETIAFGWYTVAEIEAMDTLEYHLTRIHDAVKNLPEAVYQ